MRRLFVGFISLLVASSVLAKSAEQVFSEAEKYTAYILTSIEVPFVEDEVGTSIGTGFIVDLDRRWIMTNAHVSGHSPAHITVEFRGSDRVAAKPIYIDPLLDLAILEFAEPEQDLELSQAQLECDSVPGTGHAVGAYGHPWGLRFTGTMGIISGRTFLFGNDWLQTDAPINGGNSGGPLISMKTGKVVGINSAKADDQDVENTNFAVIGLQACRILTLLTEGKEPRPPQLGVTFFEKDQEPTLQVAAVSSLTKNIGIVEQDRLIAANGKKIDPANQGELLHRLRGNLDSLTLTVERAADTIELQPNLQLMPAAMDRQGVLFAGMLLAPSNIVDLERLAKPVPVMVHYVQEGSVAEAASIGKYDQLTRVNGRAIDSMATLRLVLAEAKSDDDVALSLLRFSSEFSGYMNDLLADVPYSEPRDISFER
jgi:serine protease Do